MPFQRRHDWEFPWEKALDEGREFIASISAHDAQAHWFLVLRRAQHNGVLVVRYHNHPIGVVGSPLIFLEILRQRRAGKPAEWHRDIEVGLEKVVQFAQMQNGTKRAETPATLLTQTIEVRSKPTSVVALLQPFDAVAVTYRQHNVRAFFLSLSILVRAWTDVVWTDQLVNWMIETLRATYDSLWL